MTTTTDQTSTDALTNSTDAQAEVRKAVTDLDRTLDAASARAAELDAELHAITTEGRVDTILFRLKAAQRDAALAEERAKDAEARADKWMGHACNLAQGHTEILELGKRIGRQEIRDALAAPLTRRQRVMVALGGIVGGAVCWGALDLIPHYVR